MTALTSDYEGSPSGDLPSQTAAAWKVVFVGRDEDLGAACRRNLTGLSFRGSPVELLEVADAAAAGGLLAETPDVALLLLAAGPEDTAAALDLVAQVRDGLHNRLLRIVLCTASADAAFERDAVQRYEINEFRSRAELTGDRLATVVLESLRSFATALSLENNYKMMVATAGVFSLKSRPMFYFNMLLQLDAMLDGGRNSLLAARDSDGDGMALTVKAASGRFARWRNGPLEAVDDASVISAVHRAADSGETVYTADRCIFRLRPRGDTVVVVYAELERDALPIDRKLIDVFRDKAATALVNLLLTEELNAAQQATVRAFASLADHSDRHDTGHLGRFERMTAATAAKMLEMQIYPKEVDRYLVEQIGLASTLHDIGLYRIPESVLQNVDELMEDDFQLIHHHPKIGHRILATAATPLRGRSLLSIAAEIALGHHERYDGSGYPNRLKGEAVPVSARIAGVVDIFDALVKDNVRRKATPVPQALAWLESRAGKEFDPRIVEAFVLAVRDILRSEPEFFSSPNTAPEEPGLGSRLAALAGRLFGGGAEEEPDAHMDTHR